jgi:hypothetical protein
MQHIHSTLQHCLPAERGKLNKFSVCFKLLWTKFIPNKFLIEIAWRNAGSLKVFSIQIWENSSKQQNYSGDSKWLSVLFFKLYINYLKEGLFSKRFCVPTEASQSPPPLNPFPSPLPPAFPPFPPSPPFPPPGWWDPMAAGEQIGGHISPPLYVIDSRWRVARYSQQLVRKTIEIYVSCCI